LAVRAGPIFDEDGLPDDAHRSLPDPIVVTAEAAQLEDPGLGH
jgi:hypothetical protein